MCICDDLLSQRDLPFDKPFKIVPAAPGGAGAAKVPGELQGACNVALFAMRCESCGSTQSRIRDVLRHHCFTAGRNKRREMKEIYKRMSKRDNGRAYIPYTRKWRALWHSGSDLRGRDVMIGCQYLRDI